jgi:hypothetical protein
MDQQPLRAEANLPSTLSAIGLFRLEKLDGFFVSGSAVLKVSQSLRFIISCTWDTD